MSNAQNVRDAALALHEAIVAAKAEGLEVTWPRHAAELPAITVSETNPPAKTIAVEPPKAGRKAKVAE